MSQADLLLEALARGRQDQEFFSSFFLNRTLHPGQAKFVLGANATVNVLATANRWGKTTVLSGMHYHACVYKAGAEAKYTNPDGSVDLRKWAGLKYQTVHTAGGWETAALLWEDSLKLKAESDRLRAFVTGSPMSHPPHIDFLGGARWKFRTLGHDASGIDGNSFYLISIDEAGWIEDLETKMANVVRVRVADVRGRIVIVGTFKPGVSKDFYKIAVRASAYCGEGLTFDHRSEDDEGVVAEETLDASIRRYLADFGISLDEFTDALGR